MSFSVEGSKNFTMKALCHYVPDYKVKLTSLHRSFNRDIGVKEKFTVE